MLELVVEEVEGHHPWLGVVVHLPLMVGEVLQEELVQGVQEVQLEPWEEPWEVLLEELELLGAEELLLHK